MMCTVCTLLIIVMTGRRIASGPGLLAATLQQCTQGQYISFDTVMHSVPVWYSVQNTVLNKRAKRPTAVSLHPTSSLDV
jgi:hypothetical protein